MRFFIIDDDHAIRSMLTQIIEDEDLGEVAGEAENGSFIDNRMLITKKVDILLVDLLMPVRDGIETIRQLASFDGKIIMISQIESKEMIGKAYSLGIEYYITKPINRLEVVAVIQKVTERIYLQKSIHDIQKSLNNLANFTLKENKEHHPSTRKDIIDPGSFLLSELGIISTNGSKDLLDMLEYLLLYEKEKNNEQEFPSLNEIFYNVATKRLGKLAKPEDLKKEIKASEQRIRRAIFNSLLHFASLGLTDYSNPKFENYAAKFFDFAEVRKMMLKLQRDVEPSHSDAKINIKKFIQILYIESKSLM